MKRILPVLALIVIACAGCTTRYTLTLNNGDAITARGKPHFDAAQGRYYFTDANGQPASISSSRVREVAPSSMTKSGPQFLRQ